MADPFLDYDYLRAPIKGHISYKSGRTVWHILYPDIFAKEVYDNDLEAWKNEGDRLVEAQWFEEGVDQEEMCEYLEQIKLRYLVTCNQRLILLTVANLLIRS